GGLPARRKDRRAHTRRRVLSRAEFRRCARIHRRRAPVNRRSLLRLVGLAAAVAVLNAPGRAQEKFIVVASTTSTEQSGLFGYLLPAFEKDTGIRVRVVAVGTGQALDIGRRGDADVVFVHDRPAEDKFMAEKEGVKRYPVMYNDFVLVGPRADPAK